MAQRDTRRGFPGTAGDPDRGRNCCLMGCLGWLMLGLVLHALLFITVSVLVAGDWLTAARLTPEAPALMWSIWGALIGGTLGFWLSAPLYGLRAYRPLLVATPLLLMLLCALAASLV